jgi:hypothetical protein
MKINALKKYQSQPGLIFHIYNPSHEAKTPLKTNLKN